MSEEFKNVRRIQSVTRTNLTNELKTKMLGMATEDYSLGFKDSTGSMHWYTQEGGDAFFDSLELNFNGLSGYLAVDTSGKVVIVPDIPLPASGGASSTGCVSFDGLSINTDTTKFNVGAVQAWFVDNTDPSAPISTFKEFTAQNAIAVTDIATQNATYIAIDVDGVIHQQGTQYTETQYRDWIPLGVVVHSNRTTINVVNNLTHTALNATNQLEDLMHGIGDFNISGNVISANGANLNINKSGGSIFKHGVNFVTNPKDPHTLDLAGLTAPNTIRYRTQDGTEFSDTDTIDVNHYDVAGTRTAVSSGWTVQRVFLFSSNLIRIQYGQATYSSKALGIASIGVESFNLESNIAENGIFIGCIVVQKNATDLSNPNQAEFIQIGKFGSVIGGGTSSIDTLQTVYDNSSTPEITTNSALGAVSFKNGTTVEGSPVVEIVDALDAVKITMDDLGNIISKPTGSQTVYAKMGRDPQYDPYAYFGGNTTTRHGLTIGSEGTLVLENAYAGSVLPESMTLTVRKKMASDKWAMMNIAENGKFYFASNTDTINMLKPETYTFIGDMGISNIIASSASNIRIKPTSGVDVDTTLKFTKNGYQWTTEYHGVETPRYTYDFGTRTYTLTTGFVFWQNGIRYTLADVSGNTFIQHPSFTGITFVYLNANRQLETAQTPWTIDTTLVPLFAVYTNPTNAIMIPFYENHCYKRNTIWHSNAHTSFGTQAQADGFSLTGIYPKDATPSDARLKYAVNSGWIKDEDIKCTLSTMTTPGTGNDAYPILYRVSGTAVSYTTAAFPYYHVPSGYIAYNDAVLGQFTQAAANKYINYFVIAVPCKTSETSATDPANVSTSELCRYMWVAGQAQHDNEASADGEEWGSLNLGDLSYFTEFVPIYKVTFKTAASYTTSGKCIVWSYKRLSLSRAAATAGVTSNVHNALTGRDATGAHPFTAITGTANGIALFDTSGNGTTTTNFTYDTTNGLTVEGNSSEAIHVRRSDWNALSQAGICYELQSLESGVTVHPTCYAESMGEIVSNVWNAENGAFVVKAVTDGTMTEQARFVGGSLIIQSGVVSSNSMRDTVYNSNNGGTIYESAQLISNPSVTDGAYAFTRYLVKSGSGNTQYGWFGARSQSASTGTPVFVWATRITGTQYTEAMSLSRDSTGESRLSIGGTYRNNLDVYGSYGMHISSTDVDSGMYMSSNATNESFIGAGCQRVGGQTYVRGVSGSVNASFIYQTNGTVYWYSGSGTVGSTMSPTAGLAMTASVLYLGAATAYETRVQSNRGVSLTGTGAVTTSGDFAHGTTMKGFVGFGGATNNVGNIWRTIFSMYSTVTISNTTGLRTMFGGSARGTATLVADTWQVGKRYRITVFGTTSGSTSSIPCGLTIGGVSKGTGASIIPSTTGATGFSLVFEIIAQSTTTFALCSSAYTSSGSVQPSVSSDTGLTTVTTSAALGVSANVPNTSTTIVVHGATIEEC